MSVIPVYFICLLKAEKAQHYIRQALYGQVVMSDGPYDALHRDRELVESDTSTADLPMAVDAKKILDELIDTQRKSQLRTRIQLAAIEKQFHKVKGN